jgi:alkane 1-monooxygenase
MTLRAFKYLSPFIIYVGSFRAFMVTGWEIWLPLIYAWIIVPLLELVLKPNPMNLNETEEELAKSDRTYDFLLYFVVILQYVALARFLYAMSHDSMTWMDIIGRTWVMGMLCGVFGINVGHELGHRNTKFEQILARTLLLSSLYMHFFIEHNKGHHKRVATPEDPSSARFGEWVYAFYFRSIIFSYFSAWRISNNETIKKGNLVFSFHNEMIRYTIIQIMFTVSIFLIFGWFACLCFLLAAGIGILLLETVNYIEHYGLQRNAIGDGKYERAMPAHSWNSNHVVGRLMLFELSRHSDHHYLASRKYQVLRHHDDSPQMPTGYPGMMLLSLFPPAWFFVMNKRVRKQERGGTMV